MDFRKIKTIHDIMRKHFHMVDSPFNDSIITDCGRLVGRTTLCWVLNNSNKITEADNTLVEILNQVNQLNFGEMELHLIGGAKEPYAYFTYNKPLSYALK